MEPLDIGHAVDGVVPRFRAVHAQGPDRVAVTDERRALTVADVATEAAGLLALLRRDLAGVPGDAPVAVLHSHDAGAVAALLAVLASGHPVLVLDPRTPAARLSAFAEQVGAVAVLADDACAAVAAELPARLLRTTDAPPAEAASLWESPPDPDRTAVLAFTSGSTGRPKVVLNDHHMLVRDAWANSVATGCYGAGDTVAHTLPMAFHAGLMATVAGLVTGATMKLYDVRGRGIGALAAWIEAEGCTVMQASPAILRAFVATGPAPGQLARIRSLTVAGEAAHGADIAAARALLPPTCTVRNRYGSSETGLIAEFALPGEAEVPDGALPVGRAVPGTTVALVADDGRPAAPGEPGIVTITARHLAQGYADTQLTGAAFATGDDGVTTFRSNDLGRLDADGNLVLLGRRDHSVKIRGYLVEPGEVDAALFALPDVKEAVTVGVPRPSDGLNRLVAYVVSTAERPQAVAIRSALHEVLPGWMVPETIVFLEALPRTDRGKLDRAALPEPPPATTGAGGAGAGGIGAGAMSEWEDIVHAIWCQVLALPEIGLDDDFFELGGDSLAAEALMSAMVTELGVPESEATNTLLVQAPTLGAFARRLTRRTDDSANPDLVPLRTGGDRPPLFLATGGGGLGVGLVPVVRHLSSGQPVYALQMHALERRGLPDWSVAAAARRHIASMRSVQPRGPYHLAGHSFGGIVALEISHQLHRQGEEVAVLIMLDSFPPDPTLHVPPPPAPPKARLKGAISLALTGLRGAPGEDQYWRFYQQSMFLHRRYRCDPWHGPTVVVVADSPEKVQRSMWDEHLTGPWRMVEVSGDHFTMNRDPHAAETAAAIRAALEQPVLALP